MTRIIFSYLRTFAASTLIFAFLFIEAQADARVNLSVTGTSGPHLFHVDVMKSAEDRARGLMFRRQLDENAGMLFDFHTSGIVRMWMKNTYIPLDMLFIRSDGVIANVANDTVPHSTAVIASDGPVRYVLEINAGLAKQLGIKKGSRVSLPTAP